MRTVVIIVLLVVAVVAVVALVRARRARPDQGEGQAPPRRDPFADAHGNEQALYRLKVGDVVTFEATDHFVRGSIRYDASGYTWAEHLIDDDRAQHWVSVEDDEGIAVAVWQEVAPGDVDGEPGADRVAHGQHTYRLQEQGSASYTAEGTTGTAPTGTARYVDYDGPDGALLSFEQFGQSWEVSVGRPVRPRALIVYPTSS